MNKGDLIPEVVSSLFAAIGDWSFFVSSELSANCYLQSSSVFDLNVKCTAKTTLLPAMSRSRSFLRCNSQSQDRRQIVILRIGRHFSDKITRMIYLQFIGLWQEVSRYPTRLCFCYVAIGWAVNVDNFQNILYPSMQKKFTFRLGRILICLLKLYWRANLRDV